MANPVLERLVAANPVDAFREAVRNARTAIGSRHDPMVGPRPWPDDEAARLRFRRCAAQCAYAAHDHPSDLHPIETQRLGYESGEQGLLAEALATALGRDRPLLVAVGGPVGHSSCIRTRSRIRGSPRWVRRLADCSGGCRRAGTGRRPWLYASIGTWTASGCYSSRSSGCHGRTDGARPVTWTSCASAAPALQPAVRGVARSVDQGP